MENKEFLTFIDEHREDLYTTSSHKRFLGQEFLTWLWFFIENSEGRFEFKSESGKKIEADLRIEDKVSLTSKIGQSYDHVIKGGNPGACKEAALALRLGKSVKELRLALDCGEWGFYNFSLNADDLSPRAIALPEPRDDIDETPLEQRVSGVVRLGEALDYLMRKFMDERASKVWESERLDEIRSWIKTRQNRDGSVH